MSDTETGITLLGTIGALGSIVSIGSAICAYIQAKRSGRSASKAERLHRELIERRKTIEVSQVHIETSRILKAVSTVGPSCNPKLLRGVNCSAIAKEVEEYSRYINEHSAHFGLDFKNLAIELNDQLLSDIALLSEATTPDDKKKAGVSIYTKINSFMPFVKELADEKKESK